MARVSSKPVRIVLKSGNFMHEIVRTPTDHNLTEVEWWILIKKVQQTVEKCIGWPGNWTIENDPTDTDPV